MYFGPNLSKTCNENKVRWHIDMCLYAHFRYKKIIYKPLALLFGNKRTNNNKNILLYMSGYMVCLWIITIEHKLDWKNLQKIKRSFLLKPIYIYMELGWWNSVQITESYCNLCGWKIIDKYFHYILNAKHCVNCAIRIK